MTLTTTPFTKITVSRHSHNDVRWNTGENPRGSRARGGHVTCSGLLGNMSKYERGGKMGSENQKAKG